MHQLERAGRLAGRAQPPFFGSSVPAHKAHAVSSFCPQQAITAVPYHIGANTYPNRLDESVSESLSQRIVNLLSAHSEPLTASFISFNFNDHSFAEVCEELGRLQEAGVVSLDYSGYHLRQDSKPRASEVAEPTPSNVAEEAVAETAPSDTSEDLEPEEPVVAATSAASEGFETGEPAEVVASAASEESEPDEPSRPFPVIASFLRLDERLKDFLAAHHKKAATDDVEEDELPAAEVVPAVAQDEPPEAETAPVVVRTELPAIEPLSADEAPECMVMPDAPAPTNFEPEPIDETPASSTSSNVETLAEDAASPVIESASEVTFQAEEEVPSVTEPPTDETPLTQPEETEASVPAPMEVDVEEPVPHPQRLSYEDLLDELEQAEQSEGLEVLSDLPFIGAPRTSFRDDRDLLYAKLSGTKAGEGLDEYPDEPTIGVPQPIIDEVDREYRSMLAEFSPQDSAADDHAGDSEPAHVVSSHDRAQERDEYRELLAMLFLGTSDNTDGDARTQSGIPGEPTDDETFLIEEVKEPAAPEVLTYRSSITALELSARPLNTFLRYQIDSLEKLVREVDSLYKKPGIGLLTYESIVNALDAHAADLPTGIDVAQQLALAEASGSRMFVFDVFGRLCHVKLPEISIDSPTTPEDTAAEDVQDEFEQIKALPIERLTLTPLLRAVLRRKGCWTVGQAAALSDGELLAEKGIGYGTILRFRDSIDELGLHQQRPSDATPDQGATSILLEDTTSLNDINLPNRLKHALLGAGYRTIGEVAALSEEQVRSLRGVGEIAIERLNEVLFELERSKAIQMLEAVSQPAIEETPSNGAAQEHKAPHATFSGSTYSDALQGIQQALEICRQRQYPIYEASFSACMPIAAVQSIGDGLSADEYCNAAIEVIEGSDDLIDACESALRDKLAQERLLESTKRMAAPIPIPPTPEWEEAANRVARADEWCLYHDIEHTLELRYPSLDDWIESSLNSDRDKSLLRTYLGGSTLQECGRQFGLTREGVRQIVLSRLNEITLVEEDRYRHLLETYNISKNDFLVATGEPISTYHYLHLTGTQQAKRTVLSKALRDELVPQSAREGIRRVLDRGYVYADGARIPLRKEAILTHIVMHHAFDRYIKVTELDRIYKQFLTDNHLEDNRALQFKSIHNLEACIDRYEQIMRIPHSTESKYGGSIRYYDALAMDFDPLRELLSSGILGNVECSTVMLLHDDRFKSVLEKLDIRNGYELHHILNKYCKDVEGMTTGRTPNVTFGTGNRHDQILDLIKELSPASASDLAEAYEERYGVDVPVFHGSYLTDFKIYLRNGKYVYNDQGLDKEQKAFASQQLNATGRDYISTALVKARFKDRFPNASTSLINARNLADLGFHPSAGLLIRNGVDERELFGNLLDGKQRFSVDDENIGKDVFDNPAFQAELAIRERAYRLIEFEKGCYLSTRVFESLDEPLYDDDLRDYVEQVLAYMTPNRPYTVQSLVASGFRHKLDVLRDDFGLGDYFYASLLATGSVGGRLKFASIADVPVFCKTMYGYSAPVMMEQVISTVEAMDVDDLKYLLEDEYGITASTTLLRSIIKRSDLYFNETLDMVFDSEETYKRKAREWIS